MVNVGLRGYIWEQKGVDAKLARERWRLNGCTYRAYRNFLQHLKEAGAGQVPPPAADGSAGPKSKDSARQAVEAAVTFAGQPSPAFAFAGMKHIFDGGTAPVTVLKFGHHQSDILAWGCSDGTLRIGVLGDEPRLLQELHQHKRPITDIDWSADDSLLASTADDGGVCLWLAVPGALVRTFRSSAAAACCRFSQANQNFLMVGTSAGEVLALNASNGLAQQRIVLPPYTRRGPAPGARAMAAAASHVFVGDSRGGVHTLGCEMRGGVLQTLQALGRAPAPSGREAPIVGLVLLPFSATCQGPALLASLGDGRAAIYRVSEDAGARAELHAVIAMPPVARTVRAKFCPTLRFDAPELLARGNEDTTVALYDAASRVRGPVPVNQLQGHCAPVVDVSWSRDGALLASGDCDGLVIVWWRDRAPA